ncbi:MFS transporter [Kitasatospora sp. MMS16-BH015]|uniref:MFS transporter n=1 Tax=Kitasatospora sp. MMS16-BH015 TaxID=2018025 RepID=UPI000CA215AF|nr:MFS transporter [Kitasatospora sp. MMS16-BH015]AUG76942.1 MFS transporter [Kitasatospora sp. MMS16-BH015]
MEALPVITSASPGTRAARIPAGYRALARERSFRRLLPALAGSDLGDGMSMVAVPWLALSVAPAGRVGLYVGAAVAAYALPGVVGALVFGRWLRARSPRRLLVADSLLRAVLLGAVPLAWAAGALHPALYLALLAGSSVLHAWGSAGRYSLVAQVLPPEHRLAANALLGASSSAAIVLGPAAAGLLATLLSPAWLIGLDAASFAILALLAHRSTTTAAAPGPAGPPTPPRRGEGLRLLRRQPELLGILTLTWAFNFLYGPVEVALPLHITTELHAEASLLGAYWTAFGAGAVLGGLAAGLLRRLPLWTVTLGIVAGWGLTLLPFGFGAPAAATVTCFGMGGLVYGPFTALTFTLFQNRTPTAQLTTMLATRTGALLTAAPVGTALGGPLTAAFAPHTVIAASGAATLLLAATGAELRLRTRRPPATLPHPMAREVP